MKKSIILSIAILSGAFSFHNVCSQGAFLTLFNEALAEVQQDDINKYISPLRHLSIQHLLAILDMNGDISSTNTYSNRTILSKMLWEIKASIPTHTLEEVGFYYEPKRCTYFHVEKKEIHPGAQIVKKLIQITSLACTRIMQAETEKTKFQSSLDLTVDFDNAIAPSNNPELRSQISGLINYLIHQRMKIESDTLSRIRGMLETLDLNRDDFFNNYDNIVTLDQLLYSLISAIDIYQIDEAGNRKDFHPNKELVEKLIEITKRFETLAKNRII